MLKTKIFVTLWNKPLKWLKLTHWIHCMKSVCIQRFSGPYFLAFGLNVDQKNSEYRHFLCSDQFAVITIFSVHVWIGNCKGESELESEQVRVKMKNSFCLGVFTLVMSLCYYMKKVEIRKGFKYVIFCDPYSPLVLLNTENYGESLCSQSFFHVRGAHFHVSLKRNVCLTLNYKK